MSATRIHIAPGVDEALVNLGFDAQTSGGLLIAVPPERLEAFRQSLARRGVSGFVIGRIAGSSDGEILLSAPASGGEFRTPNANPQPKDQSMKTSTSNSAAHHDGCCADIFNAKPRQVPPPKRKRRLAR